ncbi:YczE/YyaS/YitT family protein [Metabacillus malikii]|uniref:Membrane protein YczE n=1 Tax=Metabacillus malikii TaxID=1504265 RepID=A0ABT9ZDI1_9BACI|nr:hypothetical protein [Metabacillus malikii]MDQ0229310.1 putative membrane protein YczE [Metabacillus malikii]
MLKKSIFYIVGMFIACTGVGLVIKTDVGAGPWDAFYAGSADKLHLSIGTCMIIGQIILLFINSLLLKKRPAFESVITFVLWGIILDICYEIFLRNVDLVNYSLLSRWAFFLFAVILIGVGIGVYLVSSFPAMPYDGTMLALVERFGINMNIARTILEGIGLVIAYLVGGPVGLGSLIFVLLLGMFIQACHTYAKKVLI